MIGRRLVVAVLLLHHIEGVCKPFTAVSEAARVIISGFVARAVSCDRTAAVERAVDRQVAAVERARVGRQRPVPVSPRRRVSEAIEPAKPVASWAQRIQQRQERSR